VDLVGLVKELERQKENSLDLIAESQNICALPDKDFGILLGVLDRGMWPLTEWAHLQLAEKIGIPKRSHPQSKHSTYQ